MTIADFGTTATGLLVHKVTLHNADLTVTLQTLGTIVHSVHLPGILHNLTIGSDHLPDYEGDLRHNGSLIAPVVNRLSNAAAPLQANFTPSKPTTTASTRCTRATQAPTCTSGPSARRPKPRQPCTSPCPTAQADALARGRSLPLTRCTAPPCACTSRRPPTSRRCSTPPTTAAGTSTARPTGPATPCTSPQIATCPPPTPSPPPAKSATAKAPPATSAPPARSRRTRRRSIPASASPPTGAP